MKILKRLNEKKTKEENSFLLHGNTKIGGEVGFEVIHTKRERELLLSRFPAVRTVGSLRAKK